MGDGDDDHDEKREDLEAEERPPPSALDREMALLRRAIECINRAIEEGSTEWDAEARPPHRAGGVKRCVEIYSAACRQFATVARLGLQVSLERCQHMDSGITTPNGPERDVSSGGEGCASLWLGAVACAGGLGGKAPLFPCGWGAWRGGRDVFARAAGV